MKVNRFTFGWRVFPHPILVQMKQLLLIAALLSLFSTAASAQSGLWRDQDGKPVAETASMKSQDGFAGSIVVTTDTDWKKKWETPPDTKPNFTAADKVAAGQPLTLLIFFSNAKPDGAGKTNVRCDLSLVDPKGKVTVLKQDTVCFDGAVQGPPQNIYLSRPIVATSFEASDPVGTWSYEVVLRDEVRKVSLPLRASVTLK